MYLPANRQIFNLSKKIVRIFAVMEACGLTFSIISTEKLSLDVELRKPNVVCSTTCAV